MSRFSLLLVLAFLLLPALPAAAAEDATCADTYQIYQACYEGGRGMDQSGCDYLVQALAPRLMGEKDVSGLSAALTVGMCKQGCADGAAKKSAMSLSKFSSSFCKGLK